MYRFRYIFFLHFLLFSPKSSQICSIKDFSLRFFNLFPYLFILPTCLCIWFCLLIRVCSFNRVCFFDSVCSLTRFEKILSFSFIRVCSFQKCLENPSLPSYKQVRLGDTNSHGFLLTSFLYSFAWFN